MPEPSSCLHYARPNPSFVYFCVIRGVYELGACEMGVAEWFKGFCDNLQIRDGGTISNVTKETPNGW